MKIPIINRKNMHSFCRMCLAKIEKSSTTKSQKYNVSHNKELRKLISLLTSAEVNKKDGYPKFLCQLCFQKFENFKEYRSLCLQSKRTLDNILGAMHDNEAEKPAVNLEKKELCDDKVETEKYDEVGQLERIEIREKDMDNADWLKLENHDDKDLVRNEIS